MFEKEGFIEECRAALKKPDAHSTVKELLARAVAEPSQVIRALGEPKLAGIETIYRADDLTILKIAWGPHMKLFPHDHRMWAVIGIYSGREDNAFYRRGKQGLTQHGTKELNTKDTIPLGENVIHSVTNPLEKITAAIHIYGGDSFTTPRSEWDPQTFEERPFDVDHLMEVFEESNAQLRAMAVRS